MATIKGDIKKLKRGELAGTVATVFCGVVLLYFAVCFTVARVQDIKALQLATLISAPILLALGAAVAAFCNLKFGGETDRAIKEYVRETCIENAALMHPEKNSLSFYLSVNGTSVEMQVNGYKEKVVFDFSSFGKLSVTRKISVLTAVETRLIITFCKLFERGASYVEVNFCERAGTRRKSGKVIPVICGGEPDKKAFKTYLKNK